VGDGDKERAMNIAGGKPIRVEHVVAALEQMEGVVDRLLVVFRALEQSQVLVVGGDQGQIQPLSVTLPPPAPPVVREIEPWPLLKDNC